MSLVTLLLVLIVAGACMYALNTLAPIDGKFKTAINIVVGLVLFLLVVSWILSNFFPGAMDWRPTPVTETRHSR